MKITSGSWDRRSNFQDDISTEFVSIGAFTVGIFATVFVSAIYGAAVFALVKILRWQDIVAFDLQWGAALLIGMVYVAIRTIDQAFFRERTS